MGTNILFSIRKLMYQDTMLQRESNFNIINLQSKREGIEIDPYAVNEFHFGGIKTVTSSKVRKPWELCQEDRDTLFGKRVKLSELRNKWKVDYDIISGNYLKDHEIRKKVCL